MNKQLCCTLGALLYCFTFPSHAAPPSEILEVRGRIEAPRCDINVGETGEDGSYLLGKLSGSLVPDQGHFMLPKQSKQWHIKCNIATFVTLKTIDNRASSISLLSDSDTFGLGFLNGDGKLGYYKMLVHNLKADGEAAKIFKTRVGSHSVSSLQSSHHLSTQYIVGWAQSKGVLQPGTEFTADVEITPYLADKTTMKGTVDENGNLDGSITMMFSFGL